MDPKSRQAGALLLETRVTVPAQEVNNLGSAETTLFHGGAGGRKKLILPRLCPSLLYSQAYKLPVRGKFFQQ